MRLKDKIALVTAATRGIGACIAREFAREGAIVYIGARRMDAAEKMADELNAKGLNVHAVYNDAEKHETYQSMIDTVVSEQGRIDVLVNNFGGSNPKIDKDICSTKYEDFSKRISRFPVGYTSHEQRRQHYKHFFPFRFSSGCFSNRLRYQQSCRKLYDKAYSYPYSP